MSFTVILVFAYVVFFIGHCLLLFLFLISPICIFALIWIKSFLFFLIPIPFLKQIRLLFFCFHEYISQKEAIKNAKKTNKILVYSDIYQFFFIFVTTSFNSTFYFMVIFGIFISFIFKIKTSYCLRTSATLSYWTIFQIPILWRFFLLWYRYW